MNGISLLLLVSSIGVNTSVEMDAGGQPVYVIRIESLLINELRNGQTVPILVSQRDRRIRHFKIAISDPAVRSNTTARTADSRAGDLFDYEPTQYDNGEIEYVVQISPERLESLAKGKAIEGDIAADIPEVHRFLIFVGVGQLPSQQQAASQQSNVALAANGNGNPPSLLQGAEVRANSNTQPRTTPTSTQPTKTQFQTAPQNSTRGFTNPDPVTQFNTAPRTADTRSWRNQPDQSTISPPPFVSNTQPQGTANNAFPRGTGPSTTDRYTAPPQYNSYPQQPMYPDPNPNYNQSNPLNNYPQQTYPTNATIPYQQQQQPPIATIAQRNDVPQTNPTMPPTTGWQQPPAVTQPTAQPTVSPPAPTATVSKAEVEKDRPWTPLILTTLALFASLGANAYLGWLSWSFFWRFRDAVTESARTRAQISTSRQAA